MGRSLDEIMANLPSGFDTVFQNSLISGTQATDLGIKPGPSHHQVLSPPLPRESVASAASGGRRQRQRHSHF